MALELGLGPLLARLVIIASQRTPLRGVGGYSSQAFARRGSTTNYPQAEQEASQYADFFRLFPTVDVADALLDRDVLDFGSGYGGRTVEYARRAGARSVVGVEPFERHVLLSQQYASSLNVANVRFEKCGHTTIPLADCTVDTVVSYDVLEHVQSPPASVSELFRVLRPGGRAFLAFPVYLGARSHHLDYITTVPALHWLFPPESLVAAINSILRQMPEKFGTAPQPPPQTSFDGQRSVLPTLNGLSGQHLQSLFSKFETLSISRRALLQRFRMARWLGRIANSERWPIALRDSVTATVTAVLLKPESQPTQRS